MRYGPLFLKIRGSLLNLKVRVPVWVYFVKYVIEEKMKKILNKLGLHLEGRTTNQIWKWFELPVPKYDSVRQGSISSTCKINAIESLTFYSVLEHELLLNVPFRFAQMSPLLCCISAKLHNLFLCFQSFTFLL